jgi:glycosyltransferase involved in cell wall biosynthesis
MKLSILICTMPERSEMFRLLHAKISQQIEKAQTKEVELLSNDQMDVSTGEKRNMLIDSSSGDFVCFVDDDDDVYDYYVEEILKTITENPQVDCIGINGVISFSGQNHKKWFVSKEFRGWYESADIYYRTPNHISPIRRTIAQLVGFPKIHHGEDFDFSQRALPHLKEEAIIEKPIYHYQARGEHPSVNQHGEIYRKPWR